MTRSRRFTAAGALALTLGLGLTACGGTASTTAGGASPSAGSSSSPTSSYTPLTKANFASTVLAATTAKKSAHMQIATASGQSGSVDVAYGSGSVKAKMAIAMTLGGRKLSIVGRIIDGAFYLSVPGETPAGKFLKVDSKTPGIGKAMSAFGNFDPAKVTGMFGKGVQSLTYAGATTIDGQPAYHYTMVVDTAKAVKSSGLAELGHLGQAGGSIPKTITEQIYLNADNTMRRGVVEVKGQRTTFDITKWGEPVNVSAPPAKDVIAMPTMPSAGA